MMRLHVSALKILVGAMAMCAKGESSGLWADFSAETGPVRWELHSSGYAPMIEDVADTSRDVKALNFHSVRTHDLARINEGQRVVDAHFIFPLPHLDASDPSNYYYEPDECSSLRTGPVSAEKSAQGPELSPFAHMASAPTRIVNA